MVQVTHHWLGNNPATLWSVHRTRCGPWWPSPEGEKCRVPVNPMTSNFFTKLLYKRVNRRASARSSKVTFGPRAGRELFRHRQPHRRKVNNIKQLTNKIVRLSLETFPKSLKSVPPGEGVGFGD
jgi:hypothetical protein